MFPHPIGGIILGQHPKQKHVYVGVDLHKHKHVAVIIDYWHEKMGNKIEFDNKPAGFDEFVQSVKKRCKRGITPIFGLEDLGGYGRALAVYLVEHNHIVKGVNPSLSTLERKNRPMTQNHDDGYPDPPHWRRPIAHPVDRRKHLVGPNLKGFGRFLARNSIRPRRGMLRDTLQALPKSLLRNNGGLEK